MTENKRFTIRKSMYIADGYVVVDNEHEYTFSTLSRSKAINYCRILNLLNDENNQVRKENEQLKQRNTNQYNQLNELWEIIEEENWEKLIAMKKQLKGDEERLQREWKCYE